MSDTPGKTAEYLVCDGIELAIERPLTSDGDIRAIQTGRWEPNESALAKAALKPGDRVIEAKSRGITVVIEDRVMEHAFNKVARDRLNPRALDSGAALRGGDDELHRRILLSCKQGRLKDGASDH